MKKNTHCTNEYVLHNHLLVSLLLFTAIIITSCTPKQSFNSFEYIRKQKYKKLDSYQYDFSTDVASRVSEIPDFLLELYRQSDNEPGYKPYTLTTEDLKVLTEYLTILPDLHQTVLREKLIGLYIIDGFKGSAVADYVFSLDSTLRYYIILNSLMFTKDISEWLTYRENSTFISTDTSIAINVDCGKAYKALLYALLHEVSHIIDYELHFTPYVEEHLKSSSQYRHENATTPFTEDIWNDYRELNDVYKFELRKDITVFGFSNGPKIQLQHAKDIYQSLSQIPIVSLYGCTNWAEDFADFVMAYHLTVNLGQPYRIEYSESGNVVYSIEPMKHNAIKLRVNTINQVFQNRE